MNRARNISVVVLAVVVLASAGIWFHASAVIDRRHRLADLEREEQFLRMRLSNNEPQRRVDSLRRRAGEIEASTDQKVAMLLETLSSDLRDLDVKDRSLKTSTSSINGPFRQTPLTIGFRGPFSAAFELLKRIGDDRRVVRLQRLHIVCDPNAGPEELEVSLQLESFAPLGLEAR